MPRYPCRCYAGVWDSPTGASRLPKSRRASPAGSFVTSELKSKAAHSAAVQVTTTAFFLPFQLTESPESNYLASDTSKIERRGKLPIANMGIKQLFSIIKEEAPDAIKEGEIKAQFGRKIAIVCLPTHTFLSRILTYSRMRT